MNVILFLVVTTVANYTVIIRWHFHFRFIMIANY